MTDTQAKPRSAILDHIWQSKLANWTLLPLFTALFLAIFESRDDRADFLPVDSTEVKVTEGTFDFSDLGKRRLRLVTDDGPIRVGCTPHHRYHYCVPSQAIANTRVKVSYFDYPKARRSRFVILDVTTLDGRTILGRDAQMKSLQAAQASAQDDTPVSVGVFGLVVGFIGAAIRHLLVFRKPTIND